MASFDYDVPHHPRIPECGWRTRCCPVVLVDHHAKDPAEVPGPVPDREPERGGTLLQVHQQVPSLLHGPRPAATGPVAEARGAG